MKKLKNLRHLHHIIRTFFAYGLTEKFPQNAYTRPIFWLGNRLYRHHKIDQSLPYGVRLREALQYLGPVWIKFGQMLSTRRDLFPLDIADELALLQDQVPPFSGKFAREQIEQALGAPLETWFCDFDETALASASIAQVHTATLNDDQEDAGQKVVIKVLRPDIEDQINADLSLMYQLADLVPKLSREGYRLRAREVVVEYEKTLRAEMDLRREMQNAIRLRQNFENSEKLYVPKMYPEFARQNVIVEERIYGIPVSDVATLNKIGVDLPLLAERGVQVFFTQVFRDNFFHADMHPGNIFVNPEHPENPQYIGIDCGIVGQLNDSDKRYLAESFVAFFKRDYRRVAQMHVDAGWTPKNTDIDAFEEAFREVCEPIFAKPLSEISFGLVLMNLFNVARQFNMQVQPQMVLLQKTLLYVEGLGRELYPQLDLWETAQPFLQNWLKEQMSFKTMLQKMVQQWPLLQEELPQLPKKLLDAFEQQKQINQQLTDIHRQLLHQQHWWRNVLFGVSTVALGLCAVWFGANNAYGWASLFGTAGIFSVILGLLGKNKLA